MSTKYVILGAGPAAQAAAKEINLYDDDAQITLYSAEDSAPYSPVALPYLLSGEMKEEDLFYKCTALPAENISFFRNKKAASVDPASKTVLFEDGETAVYDRLLVAIGASPAGKDIPGIAREDVFVFRTLADYKALQDRLERENKEVVICGGGLVAVEVAEKLASAGCTVTVVVRSRLLRKYFSEEMGACITELLRKHGISVRDGRNVAAASKKDGKIRLTLDDNTALSADLVVAAMGVNPNSLDGLETDGAIEVDEYMRTKWEDVYAAGDVASVLLFNGEKRPCPISPEAAAQGKTAGRCMAGAKVPYDAAVPANYLRIMDQDFFSMGVSEGNRADGFVTLKKQEEDSFLRLTIKDGCLVGAEGRNRKDIHPGLLRFLIRSGVYVEGEKDLLLEKPKETALWLAEQCRRAGIG